MPKQLHKQVDRAVSHRSAAMGRGRATDSRSNQHESELLYNLADIVFKDNHFVWGFFCYWCCEGAPAREREYKIQWRGICICMKKIDNKQKKQPPVNLPEMRVRAMSSSIANCMDQKKVRDAKKSTYEIVMVL
jgi:hypothetical protein